MNKKRALLVALTIVAFGTVHGCSLSGFGLAKLLPSSSYDFDFGDDDDDCEWYLWPIDCY